MCIVLIEVSGTHRDITLRLFWRIRLGDRSSWRVQRSVWGRNQTEGDLLLSKSESSHAYRAFTLRELLISIAFRKTEKTQQSESSHAYRAFIKVCKDTFERVDEGLCDPYNRPKEEEPCNEDPCRPR